MIDPIFANNGFKLSDLIQDILAGKSTEGICYCIFKKVQRYF